MAKSPTPSHATPLMLKWAREQDGFTIEEVAEKDNLSVDDLRNWENGIGTPSMLQLRKLAKRYRRTVPFFYLEEVPKFCMVRDFRTLPEGAVRSFSRALRRAIRAAQERQAWLSAYLQEEGFEPSPIVGSVSRDEDVATVADKLRGILGVTIRGQTAFPGRDKHVFWRRACERAGIFVFQASRVLIEEMRGCSLPDKYAPAILINAKEDGAPRCFSIIHEAVHILLGETGVSGAGSNQFSLSPDEPTERFCNQVAAEVLVPMSDFRPRVPHNWKTVEQDMYAHLTKRYGVSHSVIALRLLDADLATREYVNQKLRGVKVRVKAREEIKIPQERLAIGRVGESFARVAISAFYGGAIHGGELSTLLAMKLQHLPLLEEAVYPFSVHPNWK